MSHDASKEVERLESEVTALRRAVANLEQSPGFSRKYGTALSWGLVCVLTSLPIVAVAVPDMTVFNTGEPIVAADVNQNFSDLHAAVSALEGDDPNLVEVGGARWSLDAVYCGATAATLGRITSSVVPRTLAMPDANHPFPTVIPSETLRTSSVPVQM